MYKEKNKPQLMTKVKYFKLVQEPYTLNELYISDSDKAHVIQ